jgi:hypothetical protein
MKEMIIVYNSIGYAIGIVDAVPGIEDKVKAAIEKWYRTEVIDMSPCGVYPGVTDQYIEVFMADRTKVKIRLQNVRYYR